jgi:hypothetical protein
MIVKRGEDPIIPLTHFLSCCLVRMGGVMDVIAEVKK